MGILFIILFYISMPFLLVFMFWVAKWIWIIFGLANGNSEVIHTIKDSTCDKKPKTWGERFEEILLPPMEGGRQPPHDPDTLPWKRPRPGRRRY